MGLSLTGHAEIDHQHAILVGMAEELARFCAEPALDPDAAPMQCSASERQRCIKTLMSITYEMQAFLVGHAIYEERLMELLPRTELCSAHVAEHTAAHQSIAKRLKRIAQQIDKECPKLLAAELERIVRAWLGDHAVTFDIALVGHLKRRRKSEVDFDGELVVILDKYVFHNRPIMKKKPAAPTLDRRQLEILGRFESLSPAQRDVYWLVVNGTKNSEIASRLSISINTVKTHRTAVFQKMDVNSALQLVTKTDVLRQALHK